MILNYKGYNNNWTLEEAESITHAVVPIAVCREKIRYEDKEKMAQDSNKELLLKQELYDSIRQFIIEQTHCPDEIIYDGNVDIAKDNNVVVVIMNKSYTRVFQLGAGVYILNSSGKTVQKL